VLILKQQLADCTVLQGARSFIFLPLRDLHGKPLILHKDFRIEVFVVVRGAIYAQDSRVFSAWLYAGMRFSSN
jgi:hypothetical protein